MIPSYRRTRFTSVSSFARNGPERDLSSEHGAVDLVWGPAKTHRCQRASAAPKVQDSPGRTRGTWKKTMRNVRPDRPHESGDRCVRGAARCASGGSSWYRPVPRPKQPASCKWARSGLESRIDSAVHAPGAVASVACRIAEIRFCSVRRLIPKIWAASLRLPPTCSRVVLM